MFYTSEEHKQRFVEVMQQKGVMIVDSKFLGSGYAAALYLLTINPSMWAKAEGYIGEHGTIKNHDLLENEDLSGGASVLVHLAGNLFNGNTTHCDVSELGRLDLNNYQVAFTAIQIRFNRGFVVDSLTAHHDQQYQLEQKGAKISTTKTG